MNLTEQRGFTLWELLMTLLIAGILIGIGVPNVMEFQRNGLMTAAANQLITGLLMARNEAVKRQVPVTLCLSPDPNAATPTCSLNPVQDAANLGFIVWVDENNNPDANGVPNLTDGTDGNGAVDGGEVVLMRNEAPGGTMRLSANCGYISYSQSGFPRRIGGLCFPTNAGGGAVLFCDDRGRRAASGALSSARALRIDRPGRGQVLQETADVDPIITVTLPASGINPTCP
jgi:type IV fimbrial biogenesis protein FimT